MGCRSTILAIFPSVRTISKRQRRENFLNENLNENASQALSIMPARGKLRSPLLIFIFQNGLTSLELDQKQEKESSFDWAVPSPTWYHTKHYYNVPSRVGLTHCGVFSQVCRELLRDAGCGSRL